MDSKTPAIRFVLRVRPFLPGEISDERSCVSIIDGDYRDASEVAVYLKDPDSCRNESYQLGAFYGREDDGNNVKQIFDRENIKNSLLGKSYYADS